MQFTPFNHDVETAAISIVGTGSGTTTLHTFSTTRDSYVSWRQDSSAVDDGAAGDNGSTTFRIYIEDTNESDFEYVVYQSHAAGAFNRVIDVDSRGITFLAPAGSTLKVTRGQQDPNPVPSFGGDIHIIEIDA